MVGDSTTSAADRQPWLSIVVPAFNEADRLPQTLRAVAVRMRRLRGGLEILVMDDGSTDDTATVASASVPEATVTRLQHRGKGAAVRSGVLAAKGRLVVIIDADHSVPFAEAERLIAAVEQGADMAIGTRPQPRVTTSDQRWLGRGLAGWIFNVLVRAIALDGFHDTQCGMKVLRRNAAVHVFQLLRTDGYAFDVEAIALALRAGFCIVEVPVVWRHVPGSKVRPARDGPRMVCELIRIRHRLGYCRRSS